MISCIKSTALKLTLIFFFTKQQSNHQLAINLNIITPLNIMTVSFTASTLDTCTLKTYEVENLFCYQKIVYIKSLYIFSFL